MTTFSIPDMRCAHCKATVEAALTAVPGVAAVMVDLPARQARVTGCAAIPALIAALDQAGYPAAEAG
jgi:copper chaperone